MYSCRHNVQSYIATPRAAVSRESDAALLQSMPSRCGTAAEHAIAPAYAPAPSRTLLSTPGDLWLCEQKKVAHNHHLIIISNNINDNNSQAGVYNNNKKSK